MSNRRFEMYQYRQVIHRMRMGESDRTIARPDENCFKVIMSAILLLLRF